MCHGDSVSPALAGEGEASQESVAARTKTVKGIVRVCIAQILCRCRAKIPGPAAGPCHRKDTHPGAFGVYSHGPRAAASRVNAFSQNWLETGRDAKHLGLLVRGETLVKLTMKQFLLKFDRPKTAENLAS